MSKSWGDDLARLNQVAEEHAIASHDAEVLETHETEFHPLPLYDQETEEPQTDAEGFFPPPRCDPPFHQWRKLEVCDACGAVAEVLDA